MSTVSQTLGGCVVSFVIFVSFVETTCVRYNLQATGFLLLKRSYSDAANFEGLLDPT
jgi:hypothetical protein